MTLRPHPRTQLFVAAGMLESANGMHISRSNGLWLLVACAPAAAVDALQAAHTDAGEDSAKLSIEQQRQLLKSLYAAFWGFKLFAVALVICILGLHGACCLFPNYKRSDAVRHALAKPDVTWCRRACFIFFHDRSSLLTHYASLPLSTGAIARPLRSTECITAAEFHTACQGHAWHAAP